MGARPAHGSRRALLLSLGCLTLFMAVPAAAAIGAEVRGTVTNAKGEPLAGVEARYFKNENEYNPSTTNSNGEYGADENFEPGEYRVEFVPPSGSRYAFQYYKDKSSYEAATIVKVENGTAKTGIDAVLSEGGSISGTITDAGTHQPVAGIGAEAFVSGNGNAPVSMGYSNSNGAYTLSGIPSGSVDVAFFSGYQPGGVLYNPQFYDDQPFEGFSELFLDGNPVQVIAAHTTSGIDASMIRSEPVNTVSPVLSGTPAVGYPLTCATGTWTGLESPTYTYAWLRDGTPIAGASASLYVAQAADQGQVLLCEVTATNKIGSATAVSNTLTVPAPVAVGVTPSPTPAPIVPVIALSAAKIAVSGNAARVPIACAKANCAGSIELTEQVPAKAKKGTKATSKKQTVVLAKGSYSLAAGKSATVVVRLTAAGKSALAAAKKHLLSAKVLATVAGGTTVQKTVVLSETAPAKRK